MPPQYKLQVTLDNAKKRTFHDISWCVVSPNLKKFQTFPSFIRNTQIGPRIGA